MADEAQIAPTEWTYKMYMKLPFDLQKSVILAFNKESSYKEFARECGIYDQSLKAIQERENRAAGQKNKNKDKDQNQKTTPDSSTPKPTGSGDPRPRPKYNNEWRQKLSRQGKYFICQQEGHMMKDCTQRRNDLKEIEYASEEDQAGKADP